MRSLSCRLPGRNCLTLSLLLLGLASGLSAAESPAGAPGASLAPVTYCLDGRSLQESRRRILAHDPSLARAVAVLRRDADQALGRKLLAVTDKPFPAPSGDKHDYVSLSKYFWPDPKRANGLPYISRDGRASPENKQYDSMRTGGTK
ncbi:MAG: alginate lyase family protein [Verrucomicrobiota bacterium]